MNWTWQIEDAEGKTIGMQETEFGNQGDAESWLGEEWRRLAESGAAVAVLLCDGAEEYRMSLAPEEA